MIHDRFLLLLTFLLPAAPGAAQSFDCGKAQTPVERLICAAPEIGALDKALNTAVKARLATAPQESAGFLAASRRWLATRDRDCAVPAGSLAAERRATAIACLANAYRARLDAISAMPPAQTTASDAGKALCQRFVERYRSALAARANDPKEPNAPLNQTPFGFLANTPNSGVTRAPAVPALPETNAQALDRWAQRQTPPIRFSPQVKRDILNLGSSALLIIDHAPGTDFFVATQTQGTAHCIYSAGFAIRDGVARRVARPLWSDKPGDSCGVDRFFGVIDGRTVAIEDNENPYEPVLASRLTLKTWEKDSFGPACSIAFDYEPVMIEGKNDGAQTPEEKCDSPACAALKPAAKALVEAVQRDPLAARGDAIGRLDAAQRATFGTMEKLAQARRAGVPAPEAPTNPASYLDQNPLLAPLLHQGTIYLASVGHYTIGWRTFPDWSVKLEKLDHDALIPIGTAFVAMRRGALSGAKVE
jgi:uncharacterized protein